MGRRRDGRDVDGILILDKDRGVSSNKALQQVRNLFRARKAGHCGSLDPLATGVLPICLGQATRFADYLLGADKRYRATCRLGVVTTTGDAEGEVLERKPAAVSRAGVERTLADFRGPIEQVPPMYSALKHEGRRLYHLAREGKTVERAARRVEIHALELEALTQDELVLTVHCSKGTYIRTLAEDIGAELGCGAHLLALRRLAVTPFDERDALDFTALKALAQSAPGELDRRLLPVAAALARFPEVRLHADEATAIRHGQRLPDNADLAPGLCRLYADDGEFIGLGEVVADGELRPKRLLQTGSER